MPMVIVSPYARAGYTDSTTATFASILAYVEQTFNLAPLGVNDAAGVLRTPTHSTTRRRRSHRSRWSTRRYRRQTAYIAAHPGDPDDPT